MNPKILLIKLANIQINLINRFCQFIGYFDLLRLGSVFLNSLTLLMNRLLFQLLIRIKDQQSATPSQAQMLRGNIRQ
ncbi:hypothetical protein SAMN05421882_1004139 [Nitrosomonas communis]|uniref:Uncharacterized protein n=1 Tax=Nitrosomonas communis TaxID=44574 RepID=A0A1H2RHU0_9PROT|nr:hypothetical protein SAMN05421882_1004139 [Nitrosomonas communis]